MWQFEHVDVYPSELYHYGRKGMKWYQNIYTKGKEAIAARKAKKEQKEAEQKEALRKKVLASRSAKMLDENAHLFTKQELDAAYERLRREQDIRNLSEPNKSNQSQQKQNDTPTDPKAIAEKKAELVKNGNPSDIFKNAHLFTTQELNDVNNRLNYISQIQGKIPVEESKGKKFMDELPNHLNKINKISDEGIHLYNNVARVLTAWTGTEVPVVGESGKVWAMQTKLKNDKKKAAEEENKTKAEADKKAKEAADNLKKAQQEVDDYNRKQAQYQKDVDDNNRMHTDLNNARRAEKRATEEEKARAEQIIYALPPPKDSQSNAAGQAFMDELRKEND